MAKNPNSKSQFIRKYRKLTRDPKSFFEDSDNPVVRHLGGLAVHARDRVTKGPDGVTPTYTSCAARSIGQAPRGARRAHGICFTSRSSR